MSDMVVVAVIAAVPATISAFAAYKAARAERHTRPNGGGTVVQMQEQTLRSLGRIEERFADHCNDPYAHGPRT